MNGLPGGTPIYLCTEPVDFRKGFDGLTGVVTALLGQSVTSGVLFLFVNRKRDRIKALWWETGGLTLWYHLCEVLEVSRSAFYDWKNAPPNLYQPQDQELRPLIKGVFYQLHFRRSPKVQSMKRHV